MLTFIYYLTGCKQNLQEIYPENAMIWISENDVS